MHQGVVRDLAQQQVKQQRQMDFELQKVLEAEYKTEQRVSQSSG